MEKFIQEFAEALNGGRGALDAWLECNNEADCRAAINGYVQAREAELLAHVERLRKTLAQVEDYLRNCVNSPRTAQAIVNVLSDTPAQSLAMVRNQVREECAKVCDRFAEREMHPAECAAALRAMKEPE